MHKFNNDAERYFYIFLLLPVWLGRGSLPADGVGMGQSPAAKESAIQGFGLWTLRHRVLLR